MKYVPLYIKTHNTLLTSMIKIDALIKKAKEYSIDALTITDENMYGCMDFYKECQKNDIKPIIGLEVQVNSFKFVMYAKNEEGYKNLLKVATIKSEKELTLEIIANYSTSLICIVPYSSYKVYDKLKKIFKEIFVGYSNSDEREKINEKKVYFNEILYLDKEDGEYLKYLYGIKEGKTIDSVTKIPNNNYLLSFKEFDQDIDNNRYIYDNCNLEMVKKGNLIPKFACPDGIDSYSYLKHLCKKGLKNIFGESVSKTYIDRLKYELNIINEMGFCDYFLIVYDYIRFAKENNILTGPGRGSSAGSLVSYLLNITNVDPIKYNLIFERFLNPGRITMPDIDIDFEALKKDEVIKYCQKKYGLKNVCPIITFGTLSAKQAIRDVGKVMDLDNNLIDNICKVINADFSLKENYQKIDIFKKIIDSTKANRELFLVSSKLENLKRHTSIHASGVIISSLPLDEIIPIEKKEDGYITGYSHDYLESIGLLKMDFLSLKTLNTIGDCISSIGNINFNDIPLNDEKTIELFKRGKTNGIFQFESNGMIDFLKKLKVNNFNDIIDALALFRPGPFNNIDTYIKRKQGLETIDYLHDDLIDILKPTYGIIIYQEQIMNIARTLAGYTFAEADILRRAMSKKKEDILLKQKDEFVQRSVSRGYDENLVIKIYGLILKFASYGFPKAHAVSYALISYKMAYLKANYPLHFFRQLLNLNIGSSNKMKEYLNECKKEHINIIKPSLVNKSSYFEIENNNLICPLTLIKGMGNIVNKIGNYKDIFDFFVSVSINRKTLEDLINVGALSNFGYNNRTIIENLDNIINYAEIGSLVDDSLKPEIIYYEEYPSNYLMKKELEIYGFYLSKHPISDYKLKYNDIVEIDDLDKYFDKNIKTILYVQNIRKIDTKKNETMAFIDGANEVDTLDVVLFPRVYNDKIKIGDVIYVYGKVEKRFCKYQIIANKIDVLS